MSTETILLLDDDLRARVERLASDRQQALDAILHEALSQFVQREEQRMSLRASVLEAWADYKANGLHATFEEVDDWLGRLQDGESLAPPRCHD